MLQILILAVVFIVTGCANNLPPVGNILAIDKNGDAEIPDRNFFWNSARIVAEDEYINRLIQEKDNKIVIYIHGGLNYPSSSVDKARELIPLIQEDGYKPVFIDWRSGLYSSYGEHLLHDRQGDYWSFWGLVTAPFVLLEDLGRAVARTPMMIWHTTNNYLKSTKVGLLPSEDKALHLNNLVNQDNTIFGEMPVLIDGREDGEKFLDNFLNFCQTGLAYTTLPLFDAIGSGAWSTMKRRTDIMFVKDNRDSIETIENINDYSERRKGVITKLFNKLSQIQKKKNVEIILVAHSMGAIIANRILHDWSDSLDFSKIIYMAPACSIEDYRLNVLPYVEKHVKTTTFYNYTLHPVSENSESYGFGFGGLGSLLTQIDNFYENPTVQGQKTLGRWVNVLNEINLLKDKDNVVNKKLNFRTMPLACSSPSRHGDFDETDFIITSGKFWTGDLGKNISNCMNN